MKDIEVRLREMAEKWKDANSAVYDVCRDGAEEVRVLRKEVELLRKIEEERKSISNVPFSLGWGKGKDE